MKSKKVITLLISFTLLVSIALPGTLAVSVDQNATNSEPTVTEGTPASTPEATETPTPTETPNPSDTPVPIETEKPTETEKPAETEKPTEAENPAETENPVEPTVSADKVEIKYQVVGPETCGTLNRESELLSLPISGTGANSTEESPTDLHFSSDGDTAVGATPTAAEGFKFVGWYRDQACTQPVDASWVSNNKLIPGKTKNYGTAEVPVMGYEAATYYARFENETASLTIIRQSSSEETDENQSFIFDVTGPNGYSKRVVIKGNGSVTIKELMPGEYTIKEATGWSWRYRLDSSPKKIILQSAKNSTVDFSNTQSNPEWLSGDAYKKITFGD